MPRSRSTRPTAGSGGHADTHDVDGLAIDTGFIVHNHRTYPTLLRLFAEVGVATQPSEMSMSVRDEATGLEYAGALGLRGLFPTAAPRRPPRVPPDAGRGAALPPTGPRAARAPERVRRPTLRDFLADGGFSAYFRRQFMEPLVAAVWSCDPEVALDYPARYLFEFLAHHGMLSVTGSPQWRTVVGGSREYVAKVAAGLDDVRARHQGHLGPRDRRRRSRSPTATARPRRTTRSSSRPIPTRRSPCSRSRRPSSACPGSDALQRQRRAAAHRHLPAPAGRDAPGRRGTSCDRATTATGSPSPTT